MAATAILMTTVIFCLMFTTMPVVYFMFVIAGLLPLSAIVAMSFQGPWGFALFNSFHVLFYGAIFFFVARFTAKALDAQEPAWKWGGFAFVCLVLVAMAFVPMYGVGHGAYRPANLFNLKASL